MTAVAFKFIPIIFVSGFLSCVAASPSFPSGNATTGTVQPLDAYVGYVQDPNGRGTASLVISCLTTLILCVWSALHLNIPIQDQSRFQRILVNIRWITTGIYAPELVVFTAWRQWCSAKILSTIVKECQPHQRKDSLDDNHHELPFTWSLSHSFFACTGGFAFELESLKGILPVSDVGEDARPPRLSLTARGVALLAKCGHLPHVTKEEIMDKSKANDLAKATVIVQAGWMLAQVIGRLIAGFPVTLLEVNTVAHVLCAFSMYIFWWEKPLLPEEPMILRDESLAPLAAFMYASSEMSGRIASDHVKSKTVIKTLFAHLSLYSKTPELETLILQEPSSLNHSGEVIETDKNCCQGQKIVPVQLATVSEDSVELRVNSTTPIRRLGRAPTSCLQSLQLKREQENGTAFFERRPRIITTRDPSGPICPSTAQRWSLIEQAFERYGTMLCQDRIALSHIAEGDNDDKRMCIHLKAEQLVATHIQNWPWDDLLRNVDGLVVGMVLWLANLCYGGIHLTAWNDHFASTVEKWFWRSSACYIGFCGGLWVVLCFVVAKSKRLNDFWERWMDGEKKWWQSFGLGVVVFVCGFSLVLARAFIVVEAFVSIRQLPAKAYDTPQWSNIFPHF